MMEENEHDLIVADPIHGSIIIDPVARAIIDHPYFQRLRKIKQLGMTDLVYSSAQHTLFEHSLGTYHLARTLAQKLLDDNKNAVYEMTKDDVTCVAIAGLCQDLGKGPFHHVWKEFLDERNSTSSVDGGDEHQEKDDGSSNDPHSGEESSEESNKIPYDHKLVGAKIFNSIADDVCRRGSRRAAEFLKVPTDSSGSGSTYFRDFILKLIGGDTSESVEVRRLRRHALSVSCPGYTTSRSSNELISQIVNYHGIDKRKLFLLEIVNNERCGFDVKKLDYIQRDTYHLGIKSSVQTARFFAYLRVLRLTVDDDGTYTCVLGMHEKVLSSYMDLLQRRRRNHIFAYKHKKTISLNCVLKDAFKKCEKTRKLLEYTKNLETFCSLGDDSLLYKLKEEEKEIESSSEQSEEDMRLADRIESHNNYKYLDSFSCVLPIAGKYERNAKKLAIEEVMRKIRNFNETEEANAVIGVHTFDYGTRDGEHPFQHVTIYNNTNIDAPLTWENSPGGDKKFLFDLLEINDEAFEVVLFRLYSKSMHKKAETSRTEDAQKREKFKNLFPPSHFVHVKE